MDEREVQRLESVYAGYRGDERMQRQWSSRNPGNDAMRRERMHALTKLLTETGLVPLRDRTILEVGCGSGQVLADLLEHGARPERLYGVDLLADRIEVARSAYPDLAFSQANAEKLEFKDSFFDLVLAFTVFSSILSDEMARNVASEIGRVLRRGGAVCWYDFRYDSPHNPHVRRISRSRVEALFPGYAIRLRRVTLLPPLSRRLGRLTSLLYPALASVPPFRTHYLGLLLKP